MKIPDNITPIMKKQIEEYSDYAFELSKQYTMDLITKSQLIGGGDERVLSRVSNTLELSLSSFLASALVNKESAKLITDGMSERILELTLQIIDLKDNTNTTEH